MKVHKRHHCWMGFRNQYQWKCEYGVISIGARCETTWRWYRENDCCETYRAIWPDQFLTRRSVFKEGTSYIRVSSHRDNDKAVSFTVSVMRHRNTEIVYDVSYGPSWNESCRIMRLCYDACVVPGYAWEKFSIVTLETLYHSGKSTIFWQNKRHVSAIRSMLPC